MAVPAAAETVGAEDAAETITAAVDVAVVKAAGGGAEATTAAEGVAGAVTMEVPREAVEGTTMAAGVAPRAGTVETQVPMTTAVAADAWEVRYSALAGERMKSAAAMAKTMREGAIAINADPDSCPRRRRPHRRKAGPRKGCG